jgi:hypothetical protein
LVELHLAKVAVAGSSPVSRSILFLKDKGYFQGGIAKWEGRGLQNLYSPVQIWMPPPLTLNSLIVLILSREKESYFHRVTKSLFE